jgi:hypothetical protein
VTDSGVVKRSGASAVADLLDGYGVDLAETLRIPVVTPVVWARPPTRWP